MKTKNLSLEKLQQLEELLHYLTPMPATTNSASYFGTNIGKLNDVGRLKLILKKGLLTYQKDSIKRINFIFQNAKVIVELITYTDQKKLLIDINSDYKYIIQIYRIIQPYALTERAFHKQEQRARFKDWEDTPTELRYTNLTKDFYQKSYKKVANAISNYYITNYEKLSNLLLISAGCGPGNDIKNIVVNLKKQLSSTSIFYGGFTLVESDRATADRLNPSGCFLQGKLQDIHTHISTITQHFSTQNIETTVLVLSGTATRNITQGTYETVVFFQKAIATQVNLVIVDGYESVTITNRLAKAIGYELYDYQPGEEQHNTLLILQKQSAEQRFKYLINRSFKHGSIHGQFTLDLSLSASVIDDLTLIAKTSPEFLQNVELLDITQSQIRESDYDIFSQLIKDLSALQTIYIANIEPWAPGLQKRLTNSHYTIKQRLDNHDCYYLYEVAPLSLSASKRLGFFSNPPTKTIPKLPQIDTNNNHKNSLTSFFLILACSSNADLSNDASIRSLIKKSVSFDSKQSDKAFTDPYKALTHFINNRNLKLPERLLLIELIVDLNTEAINDKHVSNNNVESVYIQFKLAFTYLKSVAILHENKPQLCYDNNVNLEKIFADYYHYITSLVRPYLLELTSVQQSLIAVINNNDDEITLFYNMCVNRILPINDPIILKQIKECLETITNLKTATTEETICVEEFYRLICNSQRNLINLTNKHELKNTDLTTKCKNLEKNLLKIIETIDNINCINEIINDQNYQQNNVLDF